VLNLKILAFDTKLFVGAGNPKFALLLTLFSLVEVQICAKTPGLCRVLYRDSTLLVCDIKCSAIPPAPLKDGSGSNSLLVPLFKGDLGESVFSTNGRFFGHPLKSVD